MWQEISKYGNKLVQQGLVESHFGNISIRDGESIFITARGCALDEITEDGVVEVDLTSPTDRDCMSSTETIVHRAIYQQSQASAVIHAHCPFSVVESLLSDTGVIEPIDSEGRCFLKNIPVIGGQMGSEELAHNAGTALSDHNALIVHGHGTFATGSTLKEAYVITTQIEHSCRIRYWYDLARKYC